MAITRDQVLSAVERYLPRTVNYAQDPVLGSTDKAAVFSRIQQIVFTSLIVDPDTVFYLVYLSGQRLLTEVNAAIATLERLQGPEELQAITPDDPVRIEDVSLLQDARTSLVRLSTGVIEDGVFGDEALQEFRSNIEGFMTQQVFPNVDEGNRSAAVRAIRGSMARLQLQWASVIERRESTFSLLEKYQDSDLRVQVSSVVINSIQGSLRYLEEQIQNFSTETQGRIAESLLVELAAAEAALVIIGSAPNPEGTVVAGPAGDGRTGFTSTVASGLGRAEPILPVITGTDGELYLRGPGGGAVFTSVNGNVNFAGPQTDTLTDATVNFVASGVEAGMSLVFVDTGRQHTIQSVFVNTITLSPTTLVSTDLQRYAILEHVPGKYFRSPGNEFWTEHASGDSEDTTILSNGFSGQFIRRLKVVGVDGKNSRVTGSLGELFKIELTGTTTTHTGQTIQDTSATFLSDGVVAGYKVELVGTSADGVYNVVTVVSQIELELDNGTLILLGSGATYTIWKPGADQQLYDPDETFISDGVSTSDSLVIDAPAVNAGNYPITNVVSQFVVETGSVFTPETVSWRITPTANNVLFSNTVDFIASGVQVGDILDLFALAGQPLLSITAVGTNYVEVGSPFSYSIISLTPFYIYSDPSTSTDIFRQTSDDFVAAGISAFVEVTEVLGGVTVTRQKPTVLTVDGVNYQISALAEADSYPTADPITDLIIVPLVSGAGEFTTVSTLVDANGQFQTAGLDPTKHEIVIQSGANAGETYSIISVDSETQITLGPVGVTGVVDLYEVLPKTDVTLPWDIRSDLTTRHFFDTSGDAPFLGKEGELFIWNIGSPDEIRTTIDTVVSATEVWLSAPVPEGVTGVPYALGTGVKAGMDLLAKQKSFDIVQVFQQDTIEVNPALSTSAGKNIVFQIVQDGSGLYTSRVSDLVGAQAFDVTQGSPGVGFTNILDDFRVELTVGTRPTVARFVQPLDLDGDGFFESFQLNTKFAFGTTEIDYRVLESLSGQTNIFLAEEVAPLPTSGQYLTVWNYGRYVIDSAVSSTPDMQLSLQGSIIAGLVSESYVVVSGGSIYHGEYLLFEAENDQISVDDTTDLLRLKVADVLIDFGTEDVTSVASGAAGEVVEDGDLDGVSPIFRDLTTDFSSAEYGDKLQVVFADSTEAKAFLTSVESTTQIRVTPELEQKAVTSWELERNSVSSSINEAERLKQQLLSLKAILDIFSVDVNQSVDSILDLLRSIQMDRAIDLLLDGKIEDYIEMQPDASSYSSLARSSLQTAGLFSTPTSATEANIAGVDPATGRPVQTATNKTNSLNDGALAEEVDVRVALAQGIQDLVSDEITQSLSSISYEELRNRAIYELTGEVVSGVILDQDATLPWIAKTGSIRDRILLRYSKVKDAVQYMIDHPDDFEEIK